MRTEDLVQRIDELLEHGARVNATRRSSRVNGIATDFIDGPELTGFRTAALSFLKRVFGTEQPYYVEFDREVSGGHGSSLDSGLRILEAAKAEIVGGWVFEIRELVASEIFSDFIEMAEHLLESGYKDAAAVIIGSVLEDHLRRLCQRNAIDTHESKKGRNVPLKADRLNSDLASASIYKKLDQKMVTAWLDLRNSAAHGK